MSVILKARDRLLAAKAKAKEILREEVAKEREFIEQLNREQLKEGKRGDGKDMPDYVPNSKQPSAPGKITLFDIGDFHQGITAIFDNEGGEIYSTDDKGRFLVPKYGEAILKLTNENWKRVLERVQPRVIERLKEL